jgi:hypothetical protein
LRGASGIDAACRQHEALKRENNVSPPPAVHTSQDELLGTTAGIILTVIVAIVGLAFLIIPVFWASGHPDPTSTRGRQRQKTGEGTQQGDPRRVPLDQVEKLETSTAASADSTGGQGHWPSKRLEDRHVPGNGNPHGKPSSWALVAVVTAAFITGGLAIIIHTWWLLWACGAIVVLAIPAGKTIGIMDDTVAWGSTAANAPGPPQEPESDCGQDQLNDARGTTR